MSRVTHGMFGTRTYRIWANMLYRCRNPKHSMYHRYGGRGITVCDEWQSFEAFYRDMGESPPDKSLDRIDNDGPYCKANCKWSTTLEQSYNASLTTQVSYNDETLPLSIWSDRVGIAAGTIYQRLRKGWTVEQALTVKPDTRNRIIPKRRKE